MRIRSCHLILAAVLSMLLISTSILPAMAKNSSITATAVRAILPDLANSAWPMFQHDPQHTGRSPYVGPQTANLKWTFTLSEDLNGYTNSPAIASDGTLYVCANNGGTHLYAVNPGDGSKKWSNPTWHSMNSTPAVGSDGTIYVVQADDLAAYSPDHTHKWSYAVKNPVAFIYSSPAIGTDGTIYFTAGTRLFAICDNGTAKWIQTVPGTFTESSPAIVTSGPNAGTIYVGTRADGMLYAFTEAGVQKWVYDIVSNFYNNSPAIGADGTIYINSGNGRLLAITDNCSAGIDKWTLGHPIGGGNCLSSPAIGLDGTIYIGNNSDAPNSRFWAITDNGTDPVLKWVRSDVGWTNASAIIGADNTVYYQNSSGMFYALDGANNGVTKWSHNLGTSGNTAAAIDASGCVYVGTMNRKLYCFAPPSPTIASITPAQGTQGQTLTAIIAGTNFFGRPTVSFSCAGITVNSVTVTSLTQLTINITIADSCAPGFSNVVVTTSGGTITLINGFLIVSNPVATNSNLIQVGANNVGGSSSIGTTQPAQPMGLPNIQPQSASLSAATVPPGTPVTVTANIVNKSAVNGNKKVTLYVNGQVETTQGITVNSGGTSQLTFYVSRSDPGDYSVYVDGVPAGRFRVEMFRESDGILIFSIVMLAMAFVGGLIMLWRRQHRTE